jgi:hypothetical protein
MTNITHEQALDLIRKLVETEKSQTKAAAKLDISAGYLSEIITEGKPISDAVARKLGYTRVIMYKPLEKGER